jgi:prepilin signal peptidase PulO-like enzyme (type II secretory pathway)
MVGCLVQAVPLVLFGLVIGSFLNVVIVRLPAGQNLWTPRSNCPGCAKTIAWYDNIPVLSFIALRGRCRGCGTRISWRYPLVEMATTALWLVAYATFGWSVDLLVALVFLSALVAITAIDLTHRIIPDVITLPGIVAGFLVNLVTARVHWLDSLIGIAVGGGIFLVIIVASGGGMGGGDMKLGAMLGAFMGWKVALVSLFIAVMLGGALAVALLVSGRMGRKDPIPFGPFLALGGAIGILCGEGLVRWYVSGFGR